MLSWCCGKRACLAVVLRWVGAHLVKRYLLGEDVAHGHVKHVETRHVQRRNHLAVTVATCVCVCVSGGHNVGHIGGYNVGQMHLHLRAPPCQRQATPSHATPCHATPHHAPHHIATAPQHWSEAILRQKKKSLDFSVKLVTFQKNSPIFIITEQRPAVCTPPPLLLLCLPCAPSLPCGGASAAATGAHAKCDPYRFLRCGTAGRWHR